MMKKCLSGILLGALVFCCGAAENFNSVMKAARAAQQKKDYAAAIAGFQKAETLAGTSGYYKAEAVRARAKCLGDQGKYAEAIATLQTVEKIKGVPPFCVSCSKYDSAQYSEKLKKTDDALKFYLEGSKIQKDCGRPYDCMMKAAPMLVKQKKYKEAIEVYLGCKDAKECYRVVNAYTEASGVYNSYLKDFNSAMKLLDEAEKIADKDKDNGNKLKVIYTRSYVYRDAKKYDAAFNEFMRVEKIKNPQRDWAAALYSGAAGIAFDQKKDVKLAKKLMAKSVAYKSSWGTSKYYKQRIESAK